MSNPGSSGSTSPPSRIQSHSHLSQAAPPQTESQNAGFATSKYPQPGDFVQFQMPTEKKRQSKRKVKDSNHTTPRDEESASLEARRERLLGEQTRADSRAPSVTPPVRVQPNTRIAGPSSGPSFRVDSYNREVSPPGSNPSSPPAISAPPCRSPGSGSSLAGSKQSVVVDQRANERGHRPTGHHRRHHGQHRRRPPPTDTDRDESPGPSVSEVMALRSRSHTESQHQKRRTHRGESEHHTHTSQSQESNSQSTGQEHGTTGSTSTWRKLHSRTPPVLRILTLLIQDSRVEPPENLLTEVMVPLKEVASPDDGFWADAKEVCDELQIGPSRIDGPAKAYCWRGPYKQYFLRVTVEGENDCTPVNLKVNANRTLEVFVERARPNTAGIQAAVEAATRMRMQMYTPVTDPALSPPPSHRDIVAPRPIGPYSVDIDGFENGSFNDELLRPRPAVPRKRRRSGSSHRSPVSSGQVAVQQKPTSVVSLDSPGTELSSHSRVTQSSASLSTYSGRSERSSSLGRPHVSVRHRISKGREVPSPSATSLHRGISPATPPQHQNPTPDPLPMDYLPESSTPLATVTPVSSIEPPLDISPPLPSPCSSASLALPAPPAPKRRKTSHPMDRMTSSTPGGPFSTSAPAPSSLGITSPGARTSVSLPSSPGQTSELPPTSPALAATSGSIFVTPSAILPKPKTTVSASGPSASGATGLFSTFGSSSFGNTGLLAKPIGFGVASTAHSAFQVAASKLQTRFNSSSATVSTNPPRVDDRPGAAPHGLPVSDPHSDKFDVGVAKHLRASISKKPGWSKFVASRNSGRITMSELISDQYTFVQSQVEEYVGTQVSVEIDGVQTQGVVTKTAVLKVFNMKACWGEECTEILKLVAVYGPGRWREDEDVARMMTTTPPISTNIHARNFLALLRQRNLVHKGNLDAPAG